MANICDNTLFISSEDEQNIQKALEFLDDYGIFYESDRYSIDVWFETKWTFNESLMSELYDIIPNKSDIFMRCLSVEYGALYHALWVCDENGWSEV